MINSPQSFGYDRGDPLSVNTDPEYSESSAAVNTAREHEYSGMQTILGSIEQSPHDQRQDPYGQVYRSTKSYGGSRAYSSLDSQFASSQDGAQDDYRFLGGIREVDDDEETLGGQRSASGAKSQNGKSFGGTFKGSRGSGNGSGLAEDAKVDQNYRTLAPINDQVSNPFIQNLQQQALWSSGKSSSGEFGGGAFGTFQEPNPKTNRSPSQDPESQRIDYYNRNLLTKVYNQALAQMGEKACMRFAMKEVVLILDELNQTMCKQSVHQEIIMSEETGTQQMKQIMDLSLKEQKGSAKRRHDRSVDSDEKIDSKTKELLEGLKKKSNLQLIEMLRMDSKMMQIRFGEFVSKESKIYNLYAKERERNEMLQNELLKYENSSSERQVLADRSPQAFQNMDSYSMSYQKDTIEKSAANNNLTINQLSPVSAFVRNQQHINNNQQDDIIHEVHQSFEEESDLRINFLKLLDQKDKEIIMLNEYVDNLKSEFLGLQQPELVSLTLQQNKRILRSESSSADLRSTLEAQQDKMIQLHTSIQNLRRQNSWQDNQLHQGISVQTVPIKHEDIIKLEEELSQLKHEMNETRRIKLGSSPSRKQGDGVSYENTGATRAAHQRRVIEEERKQHSRSLSESKQTNQMLIGGHTMEYFSEPSSNQTRRIPGQQQHISEPQISVNTQHDIKNIQMMADTLNIKLKEVLIKNHDLQLKDKQLTNKIQNREFEYAELRVLTRDLQSQAQVNSEALDKAGKVIQKLNQDLQKSLDAAGQIQNECERLKQDGRFNKRKLQEMDENFKNQEEANEGKIQRIDNELNLEINQLKDALGQYQNDSNQEMIDLQYHLEELQNQLSQQKGIQHKLEAKITADSQAFKDQVNKKNMEMLGLQDKNLSVQIQMNKLESQLEQDIDVRDQVNEKQNMFLKNQINELHIKLNSKTQNQKYKNENQRNIDQDGELIPKVNESYLTTLAKEFTQQSNELQKIRGIFSSKSQDALDSFLHTHKEQFDSFKLSVLDNLICWNQKVNELSRLANKYYDTLEEYKMLFVQMKQVIKEKDLMVRNMRNHSLSIQQIQEEKYGQMNCSLLDSNFDTLANLKNMTRVLENKINVKELEVEELLKYQEEFRQEYLKTCEDKEALFRDNQSLSSKVEYLDRDLQNRRKIDHEYKEKLRTTLGIQEGPHQYDVVVQHVESVVECSKAQKLQIRHYQEKCEELTLEIENQRGIFHLKMSDMEKQLEDSQKQYIDQQDDSQMSFLNKEQDFDKTISQLTTDLEKSEHEIQLRERQIRKHETKVEDEIEKQRQLQINIEELMQEQNRLKEINIAFKETCEIVQDKLKETQEHLDTKVTRVDQLDFELKQAYNRVDNLEVNLYNSDNEIKQKSADFDQLTYQTTSDISTLQVQSKKLRELEELTKHLSAQMDLARQSEKVLTSENLQQKQQLREMNTQSQTINYQSEEIKQYQDSIAYLSRQLDEQTLAQLDSQILKKENKHLEDEIEENKSYINQYVHYSRNSMNCQTDDSGMVELDMMGQEVNNLTAHLDQVLDEQEQLREAMRRQMNDIDRLIDEKRQLEREIDQKNAKINNLQNRESTYASENVNISNQLRQRSNSPDNSNFSNKIGHFATRSNFDMVLSEKQNYINNLENELNDLRVENEKLKDKVIVYEMENFGAKSIGQTNNYNERTLAESHVKAGTKYSAENYRISKNNTQKVGYVERPPRFEKTQQHVNRGGAPQSSFDRSLNFGLTSYQSSHYIPDNQKPPMRQPQRPEYYTLNQSENDEQMTPYLQATETDVSQRTESPMRVAARRYPNIQQQ